jgi:H+-translocating NAD(P) transhydrogenase subunit alpha
MRVGIPKEADSRESRVATTPKVIAKLQKIGFSILVEKGAGNEAFISDQDYQEAGATIIDTAKELWAASDIIVKMRPPAFRDDLGEDECDFVQQGQTIICMVNPGSNTELVEKLAKKEVTLFALECIPRITRAQKMDVLSSQGNIAGYRAVVEAAQHYGGFFSGQMTAAGKSPPAKVLIIGAGVAGLAAIGAARGLGAIVRGFDVRAAAREQVQSMGAEFLQVEIDESGDGGGGYAKTMSKEFIDAEMALFREQAKEVDIVITTALIPNKPAPKLWLKDMLEIMRNGSVVVDLAAERGGNCEGCVPDEVVVESGVTIVGYTNLACRMPVVSSEFFSMNLFHLLDEFGGGEGWTIDLENEITRGCIVLNKGEMLWPAPRKAPPPPKEQEVEPEPVEAVKEPEGSGNGTRIGIGLVLAGVFAAVSYAPSEFVQHFTVFVLACFIGWQVIWNVSHSLHTPLMSVTNAISGIIIVGGILQLGSFGSENSLAAILATVAILVAAINIAGGFLVTQRMLAMFRRDDS